MTQKVDSKFNPLENRVILVKPVIRATRITPKGHSGNWLFDNTSIEFCTKLDINSGNMVEPLSAKEREFFENPENRNIHGLDFNPGDLSANKLKDNFWKTFKVKIIKKAKGAIPEEATLMTLDLSKPYDFFKYKILLTNDCEKGSVALGMENKFSRASNRIVLVEKDNENIDTIKKLDILETVNKFFYSINSSADNLRNFLRAYNFTYRAHVETPEDAGLDWYKIEVQKLINSNLSNVYKLIVDKSSYKDKIFIITALKNNLIKIGKYKNFETQDGVDLGRNLEEVIVNINSDEFQDLLMLIKTKISK